MKAANICLTKLRQLRHWKVYTNLLNFSVYDEILPSGIPRTLQNINDRIFQWIIYFAKSRYLHCVKSVQIRSFFWSLFSCSTEYRKIRIGENSVFGPFSRSVKPFREKIMYLALLKVFDSSSKCLIKENARHAWLQRVRMQTRKLVIAVQSPWLFWLCLEGCYMWDR